MAALIQVNSSPALLFGALLAFSLMSLAFFLLAVRSRAPQGRDQGALGAKG